MSDLRELLEQNNRKQAQIEQAKKIVSDFDKQWVENDYLLLSDLLWVLAEASPDNREAYILPIIQSAITSKDLTVWDENKSFKLNDKVIHTKYIPRKTLVLKQDFIHWQQQTKAVPLPKRLIDLAYFDIPNTPNIENLIAENEALKSKVAELEQRLFEQKELPTKTKNKVFSIIYGLCCLYINKGKPLSKVRAHCHLIAQDLAKLAIEISDEALDNYYTDGKNIINGK